MTEDRREDRAVVTFGCRLNAYESEVIRGHLRRAGFDDAVVVNTCAVTAEAMRQARQTIRRLRRERPDARIVVTGCAAQIDPGAFDAMDDVDHVIGNREKLSLESYVALRQAGAGRVHVGDVMSAAKAIAPLVDGCEGRARAAVQIQTGCDHRCTFCVIPYGRGPSESVAPEAVLRQIRHLVARGVPEVVLTGVDLTAWGRDLSEKKRLGDLVADILERVPDLTRLRLSSIDAVEVDDRLMRLIERESRLMPHLHLSLQSGDDTILKRMKRRHSRADAVRFCRRVRDARPALVFGADLIAGFPTETEAMFENTLSLVDACELTWLHVFPYSPRPGTPAARMPPVDAATIKARARRLRDKGRERVERHFASLIGTTAPALLEAPDRGRLDDYSPVRFARGLGAPSGSLVVSRLTVHDGETLWGEAA